MNLSDAVKKLGQRFDEHAEDDGLHLSDKKPQPVSMAAAAAPQQSVFIAGPLRIVLQGAHGTNDDGSPRWKPISGTAKGVKIETIGPAQAAQPTAMKWSASDPHTPGEDVVWGAADPYTPGQTATTE